MLVSFYGQQTYEIPYQKIITFSLIIIKSNIEFSSKTYSFTTNFLPSIANTELGKIAFASFKSGNKS